MALEQFLNRTGPLAPRRPPNSGRRELPQLVLNPEIKALSNNLSQLGVILHQSACLGPAPIPKAFCSCGKWKSPDPLSHKLVSHPREFTQKHDFRLSSGNLRGRKWRMSVRSYSRQAHRQSKRRSSLAPEGENLTLNRSSCLGVYQNKCKNEAVFHQGFPLPEAVLRNLNSDIYELPGSGSGASSIHWTISQRPSPPFSEGLFSHNGTCLTLDSTQT